MDNFTVPNFQDLCIDKNKPKELQAAHYQCTLNSKTMHVAK